MELSHEEWRTIPSFPDYAVSTHGRVKRLTARTNGKANHIMAQHPNKQGYLSVILQPGHTRQFVHRLVLAAFMGRRPPNHETNHKDGNKANNHISNLEWVTKSQNMKHAIRTGLYQLPVNRARGTHHHRAKLTTREVHEIHRLAHSGTYQKTIAQEFGISQATVSRIKLKQSWQHTLT